LILADNPNQHFVFGQDSGHTGTSRTGNSNLSVMETFAINLSCLKLKRSCHCWEIRVFYSSGENEKENAIIDHNQSLSPESDRVRRVVNSFRNLLFGH